MNKRTHQIATFSCFGVIASFSVWLLLTTNSCEKSVPTVKTSSFDTTLVWRIARYERSFYYYFSDTSRFFDQQIKKQFPDLGLTVRMFYWGGETGGPWSRILHFKSDSTGLEQAFGFYDEYCFVWRDCSAEKCLQQIAIGRQLTELSKDFSYQNDSIKLNRLLTITMDSMLAFREITAVDTNSLKVAHKKDFSSRYFGTACTSDIIKKTMQNVIADIRIHKARFFRRELSNGIWRVELKSSWRKKGTWEFDVTYLNHGCVFILWI